jgi:hypothetical protein
LQWLVCQDVLVQVGSTDATHIVTSGMGPGEDIADGQEIHPRDLDKVVERISSADDWSVRLVGNLGLGFFCNRLVEH